MIDVPTLSLFGAMGNGGRMKLHSVLYEAGDIPGDALACFECSVLL